MTSSAAGVRVLLSAGLATALTVTAAGCTAPGGQAVVGTVDDDTVTLAVPVLAGVVVDPDAGFARDSRTSPGPASPVTTLTGLGTFLRVARMAVEEGARVHAGQAVATMDRAQQVAQVSASEAAVEAARAQVGVLQRAIDDTYDTAIEIARRRQDVRRSIGTLTANRTKLLSARTTLSTTRRRLLATRSQLAAPRAALLVRRARLLDQREGLQRQLAELEAVLAQLPPVGTPTPPPGTPGPPPHEDVLAAIARARAALAAVDDGLGRVGAGLARLGTARTRLDAAVTRVTSGLERLSGGLSRVDGGLSRAREGLTQLDAAAARLEAARRQLHQRARQAEAAVRSAGLAVHAWRHQVSLGAVTSPVDGVVVSAAATGDVLAPGATLVAIRPDSAPSATVWLAPDQLGRVCVGDSARLRGDWMPDGAWLSATVTRIGQRWDYPPTSQTTDEVHLTRTVPVELTASSGALPAGAAVEIVVDGCREHDPTTEPPAR